MAILLAMSMVRLSTSRFYWNILSCCIVMYRGGWEDIKSKIYFNANTQNKNKIQRLINHLQKKIIRKIQMPQMLYNDEHFKGKSSKKQYKPKKQHNWGYKFFVLCDYMGIMYLCFYRIYLQRKFARYKEKPTWEQVPI